MTRAEPVRAPAATRPHSGRALDRRRGVGAVIGGVTAALAIGREPRLLRQRFESELASVIRARAVMLRDDPLPAAMSTGDVTAVPVPCPGGDGRARIEALFDAGVRPDEWTYQLLETAAHVGTLILEIERANGYGRTLRPPSDGAAPLIGSSAAIRRVRERIERVALTDFTVLIEGAIGPESHPNFIEVFGAAAVGDRHGEVAGARNDEGVTTTATAAGSGYTPLRSGIPPCLLRLASGSVRTKSSA